MILYVASPYKVFLSPTGAAPLLYLGLGESLCQTPGYSMPEGRLLSLYGGFSCVPSVP